MTLKKLLCLLTALLLLVMGCFTVSAEDPAIAVSVSKFNTATNSYEAATAVSDGDLIMVTVSTGGTLKKLSAVNLNLKYNSSLVSYVKNSATSHLVAGQPAAGSPIYRENVNASSPTESYLQAYVGADSYSKPELTAQVTGTLFTFLFTCSGVEGTIEFEVIIKEIYDSTYHSIKLANNSAKTSVSLSSWTLTPDMKTAFQKLSSIVYPDSKADIEAADSIYTGLTVEEKNKFKNAYPALFESYSKAWDKYYELSQNAILAAVQKEIEQFLSTNSSVLALTTDKVNTSNYKNVLDTYKAYSNLSDQAKLNMDTKTSKNLESLNEKAKEIKAKANAQENADISAKEFHESSIYSVMWGLDDATIATQFETLGDTASLALGEYETLDIANMSDYWRNITKKHGEEINNILAVIAEAIKDNEAEQAILAEISDFNGTWVNVLKLNAMTVSVNDKTAIETMLEAFGKLSPEAQARLATRKNNAQSLLAMIGGMDEIKDNDSTGTAVVPGQSSTQIVEKIVEVEKQGTSGGVLVRETPLFVKIMVIIALIAMVSMIVPVIVYCCTSKRFKAFIGKEEI